jgi:hypothetical protein
MLPGCPSNCDAGWRCDQATKKDFPVYDEGKKIVTQDREPVVETDDPKMAYGGGISDLLNTNEAP